MEIFKDLSPVEFTQPQIINNLEIIKDFFTCRIVLAANHQQHGNIQIFSTCSTLLAANHQQLGNIQRFFCVENCFSRKSSLSQKIQRLFRMQKFLRRRSSQTWKYSKIFSPAKLFQPQIIDNPKKFKQFFTCRYVLVANHQQLRKNQRLFRLQNFLRRKPSTSWKYSKIFSPAEKSLPQIIDAPKIFKHVFTCRFVLVANHQQLRKNQRLFRLQNFLRRKPSTTWKYSKIFSPQIITIPKTFKDFLACRIVLAADHRYTGNNQKLFHLQNCLSRKSSIT